MSTPHNSAEKGMIAKTVIMPGDPLRAKFIAETFLTEVTCFNEVRNMLGFTGLYNGKPVSVMGSGMGMPSMGIYSHELFTIYDVDKIIRIGSAGSYCQEARIYDVVLVTESYSESTFAKTQNGYDKDRTYPSDRLNQELKRSAKDLNIPVVEGCVHSTDVFYRDADAGYFKEIHKDKGCLAVEMESFALFHTAAACKKDAACLLTISDSFVSGEITTAQQRQRSFTNMIKIALNTI